MSRIHIANVDSKPALILDNIEVNNAFLKITDDSEKIKLRNEFFKYAKNLAKSISNENIPIYFSTSYTKLETNDLEKTTKEIDFVGECANSFYSNAIKGWTCAEKFKETECDLYII